jgi:hypothetical protein
MACLLGKIRIHAMATGRHHNVRKKIATAVEFRNAEPMDANPRCQPMYANPIYLTG